MRRLKRIAPPAWVDCFDSCGQTRTVEVHVAHRRKILTGSTITIETVTGVG